MRAVILCLLLTGCATAPKPVTVEIPVTVPCVGELPARPVNTFGTGAYPGDKAAAQAALIDSAAWEGYATKLEVVIAGCPAKP
jgi:starvation-inducible outer membrane lipoprotein